MLSMFMRSPWRRGAVPVKTLYSYAWKDDHLVRHELASYPVGQTNALFDKYLQDDKRTIIAPTQLKP
jgi:hypothetical protein